MVCNADWRSVRSPLMHRYKYGGKLLVVPIAGEPINNARQDAQGSVARRRISAAAAEGQQKTTTELASNCPNR